MRTVTAVHRRPFLGVLLAGVCACGVPDAAPPQPPRPEPVREEIDPARRCGEAGPRPTALPRALVDGTERLGTATLTPGLHQAVGGVDAHYNPSAWIGTMEVGHRGAALSLLIDRAEAGEHMPYGAQQELSAGTTFQTFIGPYRIEGRASAEEPPASVTISVERRGCPDHTVIEPSTEPIWVWLSTEAIRLHTVDLSSQMLQVSLESHGDAPRFEVSALGWRHGLTPEPGQTRSFRIDGRVVTIEEVVPGRGTRFDGTWRSSGPPRVSVRARIEPASPGPPEPAAVPPTVACGAPAPNRSTLPVELATAPAQRGPAITLAVGDQRVVEGIPLTVGSEELPARPGPGHAPERYIHLSSASLLAPSVVTFGARGGAPQLARADRTLLRVAPVAGAGASSLFEIRAFPIACPRAAPEVPRVDHATYVWLSTVGQTLFTVGTAAQPELTLQISSDPSSPSFGASSEHAYDSRPLAPTLVGHVASLDGYRVQVVDVVADPDTDRTEFGWTATTGIPAVHVQFRIDRE